jgi:hypothetical protein
VKPISHGVRPQSGCESNAGIRSEKTKGPASRAFHCEA